MLTCAQECDAVMALRARLRAPGAEWVRDSARATGVPIFSLRTPSDATLVKARLWSETSTLASLHVVEYLTLFFLHGLDLVSAGRP